MKFCNKNICRIYLIILTRLKCITILRSYKKNDTTTRGTYDNSIKVNIKS